MKVYRLIYLLFFLPETSVIPKMCLKPPAYFPHISRLSRRNTRHIRKLPESDIKCCKLNDYTE